MPLINSSPGIFLIIYRIFAIKKKAPLRMYAADNCVDQTGRVERLVKTNEICVICLQWQRTCPEHPVFPFSTAIHSFM